MQLQFVPPHGLLLKNPFSFLGMCILILTDMGFLWFTSACGKWVVGDFLEWKYLPHLHQVRMYQRTRQQLTYLYMLARSENERMQLLHQRMQVRVHEDASSSLLAAPTSVIQPVGPFSKFYLFLSNYLFPPSFPVQASALTTYIQKVCDTSLTTREDTERNHSSPQNFLATSSIPIEEDYLPPQSFPKKDEQDAQDNVHAEHVEKQPYVRLSVFTPWPEIFLLGESKAIPLQIKDLEQLELLLYLATLARREMTHWDKLITDVYDWRYYDEESDQVSGKDPKQLRKKLHKDAANLRRFFETAAREAGFPYVNPISHVGKGQHAVWRLTEEYVVKDLLSLETLFQLMLEIRNKGKEVNPQELRDFYELVISSYHNDFLDELVDQRLVGDWAQRLQIRYREMFWQILWDMAKYEGARGGEKQQEEQRDCFKRAARLYERYAFETAPRLWGVPKGEKYSRLSEHALRQSMHYYLQAGDDNSARHVRYRYDEMMKRQNEVDEEDEA